MFEGKMINNIIYKAKVLRTLFISDERYLTKRFVKKLGYDPNFKQPKTFNEKVTARMIYDRCPFYTTLADKYLVREIVKNRIGEKYLVPMIGIYDDVDQIKFDELPSQFVLKCTHDSGSANVCLDKNKFDINQAKTRLKQCLGMNMYFRKREWHYKDIVPRIIVENFINLYVDQFTQSTITTCRVHCFEGQPKLIEIDIRGSDGVDYSNIYNTSWELQSFTVDGKNNFPMQIQMPLNLPKMVELASELCFKYTYSRVDFLLTQDEVYFSEITLTPNAGRMVIEPREWDETLGKYWQS